MFYYAFEDIARSVVLNFVMPFFSKNVLELWSIFNTLICVALLSCACVIGVETKRLFLMGLRK